MRLSEVESTQINFIEYGFVDTSAMIPLIHELSSSKIWQINNRLRTTYRGATHTETFSFWWAPNLYSEKVFNIFHDEYLLSLPIGKEFQKIAKDIVHLVPGTIIRSALVRLPPGKVIPFHRDGPHQCWMRSHRLHLPVITEPEVRFMYRNYKFHIKQNTLTEIDNQIWHGLEHCGVNDRYHLILDVLPSKYDGPYQILHHSDRELFNKQTEQEMKERRNYN